MVKVGTVPRRRGTPGSRDFSLKPAARTFSPSEPACRHGVLTPTTHTCMRAHTRTRTHSLTPIPHMSPTVASWHDPVHHPGQRVYENQGGYRVDTPRKQENLPFDKRRGVPYRTWPLGPPLFLQVPGPQGSKEATKHSSSSTQAWTQPRG